MTASEGGARVASLTVVGEADVSPGARVVVDLVVDSAASRIYSGIVQSVEYAPDDNESRIECSDELQRRVDALSNEQIDAMTPGAVTPPGTDQSGYSYLQTRLSTLPYSAYLPLGGALTIQPWAVDSLAPGETIDRTLWRSPSLRRERVDTSSDPDRDPIERREYRITADVSWVRIAEARSGPWTWHAPIDACDWLDGHPLPSVEAVATAINGTGWDVDEMELAQAPWTSGGYRCNGARRIVRIIPGEVGMPVIGARWSLSRRYTRTMRGRVEWRIVDSQTRAGDPVEVVERSITLRDPRDGRDWIDDGVGTLQHVDPNGDRYADLLDLGNQADDQVPLDEYRGQMFDLRRRIAYEVARAAIQTARARRVETVTAETIIRPDIDLGDKVTVNHPRLDRTGRVSSLNHRLDLDSGSATTHIEIKPYEDVDASSSVDAGLVPDTDGYRDDDVLTPGLSNGGDWLGTALTMDAGGVRTRNRWLPEDLPLAPGNYIGGLWNSAVIQESDTSRLQGWVANVPRTPPEYYNHPEDILGFWAASPAIEIPEDDQETPVADVRRLIAI